MTTTTAGYTVLPGAFAPAEVEDLRAAVEAAVRRVGDEAVTAHDGSSRVTGDGHVIQHVLGASVHWEPGEDGRTVRNLRPVTQLDTRLAALWRDPRLTGPAADLLGVPEVAPLTSKISFKRAMVGSEFSWHQDYTFLHRFLGDAAREAVTAMVFLDDADGRNGALRLLPGSHLTGPRHDRDEPRSDDAAEVLVEVAAGTVVAFPALMVHRSHRNRSPADRRALLLLYQPAGRPHLDESEPA